VRLRNLARNASWVAAGGFSAAVAALLLRSVIAFEYGATEGTDALLAALQTGEAFTVPLVWILSATFIPTFTRTAARDLGEAWKVARTVFLAASIVFAALALLVASQAGPIAGWVVGGGSQETVSLTARMVPIFAAGSALAGIGGLFVGLLQVRTNFWLPAIALPLRSVVAIIAVLVLGGRLGLWAAAWGVLVGYSLQSTLLAIRGLPPMLGERTVAFRHPAVAELVKLIAPMIAGTLLLQVNQLISVRFASNVGAGSITQLNYAMGVAAVTAGLIGQSTVDAAFPTISKSASVADGGVTLRHDVSVLLRVGLFFGFIASGALAAAGLTVGWVLFGHGTFAGPAADQTGRLLEIYGFGLLALILPTILARVFYAMQVTVTPQVLAVGALAFNIVLAWSLVPRLGISGVAVAGVVAYGIYAASMLVVLGLRYRLVEWRALAVTVARGAATGAAVWLGMTAAGALFPAPSQETRLLLQASRLVSMATVGAVVAGILVVAFDEFGARRLFARR
jgi:putative peptidoglycan lipid II flippase